MNDPAAFFSETAWTLGVVGLGCVGLPLADAALQRGITHAASLNDVTASCDCWS